MKIRLIDFGVTKERCPFRPHENDAGADVFMPFDCRIKPGEIIKSLWDMELKSRTASQDMSFQGAVWR